MVTGYRSHYSDWTPDDGQQYSSSQNGFSQDGADASGVGSFEATAAATVKAAATLSQTLYLQEPGTTAVISVSDLYQGQIGDCFLISSIGELALTHPSAISRMIHDNGNGIENVTLYTGSDGYPPGFWTTAFKAVAITVNNAFPSYSVDNGAKQDVVGTQKEIWPQVLEKAVATLNGGYGTISNGGNPTVAMEELTGHAASALSPGSLTMAALQSYVAAGDLITMDTYAQSGLAYNLVSNHAYMFEKVSTVNGTPMVQLGNPWGFDQPAAIPLAQLSRVMAEVDVGRFS